MDEGIGIDLESYGSLPPTGRVVAVTGAALMIRTHLFEELAGWEELYEYYFEDIDFCLRAQSRGWTVVRVTDAIVWHAISATAARGSEFKLHLTWRNRLLLWFIHWPTSELLKTAPKLVYDEVSLIARRLYHRAYSDARLQARSWRGFLSNFPQAYRLRRQARGDGAWARFLKSPGSVPVSICQNCRKKHFRECLPERSWTRRVRPVLICGLGPLPVEPAWANWGPGIRTWQFASGLAAAGHRIGLVKADLAPGPAPPEGPKRLSHDGVRSTTSPCSR